MSATCQIISFLPLCCVFLVTSKTNCFGIGSGICHRTNYNALCSILLLPFLVWIVVFGGLETSLQYLGYTKSVKKMNNITTNSNVTVDNTTGNNNDTDPYGVSTINNINPDAFRTNKPGISSRGYTIRPALRGFYTRTDTYDWITKNKWVFRKNVNPDLIKGSTRAKRLIGSKPTAPKVAYVHALPPEIIKPDTLLIDYKSNFKKFKRKVSEPLAGTFATNGKVNLLAFKFNAVTLQPMPEMLQTPKKNQTFIRDIFRRYWHQRKPSG